MTSYMYVFCKHRHPNVEEYSTFKEALQNFVFDFDNGEAYGIGIYDKKTKTLYVPEFRKDTLVEHDKRIITRMLGFKIADVKTFDW